MFKFNWLLLLGVMGLSLQNVYADDTVNAALLEIQTCLKNQTCTSAKTDAGKLADQKALEAVAGNIGNKQELYNISADIMVNLVQQTEGDPAKMEALLLKAQNDPEGFFNSLSPEIKTKIKNVAKNVSKK